MDDGPRSGRSAREDLGLLVASVVVFLAILWCIACLGSAMFAFSGGLWSDANLPLVGTMLVIAGVAPVVGSMAVATRRPDRWRMAGASALATAVAVVVTSLAQSG